MTDQDDALVIWECALDPIEILAEERGGVRIGVTTRITEEPKLIMLSDRGVMPKGVNHWRPAGSCFLQAVNENHGRPRGIELLQPGKHRCIYIGLRVHDPRQPKPFRAFTSDQECRRRIKISGKRKGLLVQCGSVGV